jgi:hypothetical protein
MFLSHFSPCNLLSVILTFSLHRNLSSSQQVSQHVLFSILSHSFHIGKHSKQTLFNVPARIFPTLPPYTK